MSAESGASVRPSRIWSAVARLVTSRYGLLLAFGWGFAEALSWFIVAEMALILLAAAIPRRVMPWAAAVIAGSVLGVLTNAWLVSRGILSPAPLTTARMAAHAFEQLRLQCCRKFLLHALNQRMHGRVARLRCGRG